MLSTIKLDNFLQKKIAFYIAGIIFRLILEYSYLNFTHIIFHYEGYTITDNVFKYFESWVLFISFLILLPAKLKRVSDFFMIYLLFTFILPLLIFYGFTDSSRSHLYIVLMGLIIIQYTRKGKYIRLPVVDYSRKFITTIIIALTIFTSVIMIQSGGMAFFNLNLSLVYDYRDNAGDAINWGFMSYLNAWVTKAFGPFLITLFLYKKNYLLVFILCLAHIVWFGLTSFKGVLFFPLVVIFVYIIFRRMKSFAILPIAYSLVVISSLGVYFYFEDILTSSLFIRRFFFTSAHLTFVYYEFFSMNEFVYWSNSITSRFIDYPYEFGTARTIGNYLGNKASANNSFLSTGYMHAGIIGIIFYSLIVGILFRIIDSITYKHMPLWFGIAAVIIPVQLLLISADLPTGLLTHGLAISIIALYLFRVKIRLKSNNE